MGQGSSRQRGGAEHDSLVIGDVIWVKPCATPSQTKSPAQFFANWSRSSGPGFTRADKCAQLLSTSSCGKIEKLARGAISEARGNFSISAGADWTGAAQASVQVKHGASYGINHLCPC